MALPSHNSVAETIARVTQSAQTTVENDLHKLTFHAMSTRCHVNFHDVPADTAQEIQHDILEWAAQFEARYSRFIPGSLVCQINAAAGEHWVEIDRQTELILDRCQEHFRATGGAFDPTALPLIRLWNWKASPPALPSDRDVTAARELVGWDKTQRRPGGLFLPRKGMSLDLGVSARNMVLPRFRPRAFLSYGRPQPIYINYHTMCFTKNPEALTRLPTYFATEQITELDLANPHIDTLRLHRNARETHRELRRTPQRVWERAKKEKRSALRPAHRRPWWPYVCSVRTALKVGASLHRGRAARRKPKSDAAFYQSPKLTHSRFANYREFKV